MARTLPPLNALRAFEAAGRHESFSKAAGELNVSHSAISRHVRGLEDRLGAQLFRDAAQGVALTEEGRAYLARVSPALDDIAEATEAVGEGPDGRVLLNSDGLFANEVMAPHMSALWRAHPEIDLRVVTSNRLADLDRYEADFALRFALSGRLDHPGDLICNAPLFPYAAPGVFASHPGVSEILAARRMQDRPPGVWQRWAACAGVDPATVEVAEWRMRAMLALSVARGGAGVYLGSADVVNTACVTGQLCRLSEVGLQEGAYFLVTREMPLRRKALRVVREWLLDATAPLRAPNFWDVSQPVG